MSVTASALSREYVDAKKGTRTLALQPISFELKAGEVCGLLGPNGAGKTTLVKVLSTLLLPSSGTAQVCGHDVVTEAKTVRGLIGLVLGGEQGLYGSLSARQNLAYWAAVYDVPRQAVDARIASLLERVGLGGKADTPGVRVSRGMKQRLHPARGLIGNPQVLFLDEPTIGMDPVGAHHFRTLVRELRSEGKTILITTHDMDEAEALCDTLMLIDRGALLGVQTPAAFASRVRRLERVEAEIHDESLVTRLRALAGVLSVARRSAAEEVYRVELDAGARLADVLGFLVAHGVVSINTPRPSLEEAYLQVFGGAASGG